MGEKSDFLLLQFKCASNVDCTIRKAVQELKDINLKIHLLKNCISCSGKRAPELTAVE